jgi:hypothetical protein
MADHALRDFRADEGAVQGKESVVLDRTHRINSKRFA